MGNDTSIQSTPEQEAEFTPEARQRFIEATGVIPTNDMKLIPKDIVGLGYHWYPVLITSKSQSFLDQILPNISCKIRNKRNNPPVKESDLIDEILVDSVHVGSRPMGYELGFAPRFLDPKEITDSITFVKNMPNSHFVGFMNAFEYVEFTLENETFYFSQERLESILVRTNSFQIYCSLIPRPCGENRIFNWLFQIEIKPL